MSQQGFLHEDELKSYFTELNWIKLDRDAPLKLTKDVVIDLYSKFVDDFCPKWRQEIDNANQSEFVEISPMALLCGHLRFFISRYHEDHKFQSYDLLAPVRKRTIVFLNILIYIKSSFDTIRCEWQEWEREWSAQQEEMSHMQKRIAEIKFQIEELALRRSQDKPLEVLELEDREARERFQMAEKKAAKLLEHKEEIKRAYDVELEKIKHLQEEIRRNNNDADEAQKLLQLLNDGSLMKNEILNLENSLDSDTSTLRTLEEDKLRSVKSAKVLDNLIGSFKSNVENINSMIEKTKTLVARSQEERAAIDSRYERLQALELEYQAKEAALQEQIVELERQETKAKIQNTIKIEQSQLELNTIKPQSLNIEEQFRAQARELDTKLEMIKKERSQIKLRQLEHSEKVDRYIERINKPTSAFIEKIQQSKLASQKMDNEIRDLQAKVRAILGKPREIKLAANRTFIKEPREVVS